MTSGVMAVRKTIGVFILHIVPKSVNNEDTTPRPLFNFYISIIKEI